MTEASKQISWIQNLLSEMRFNIKSIILHNMIIQFEEELGVKKMTGWAR